MAQNGSSGGFYCESVSTDDSDEDRLEGGGGRDPLGLLSTERREGHLHGLRERSSHAVTLVDLTQSSVVRVKYRTSRGTVEEGLFEFSPVMHSAEIPPTTRTPRWMIVPAVQSSGTTAAGPSTNAQRNAPMDERPHASGRNAIRPGKTKTNQWMAQGTIGGEAPTQTRSGEAEPVSQEEVKMTQVDEETAKDEAVVPNEVKELVDEKGWRISIRRYQLELYRAACRRNVIAYLDTGSGKTFISVLLIRDVAAECAKKKKEQQSAVKKTVFFLVPKKVLVFQQADVLKQFTDLVVSEHSGDRNNEDVWDKTTWHTYIAKADVMVMTPQILLNILRRQMISIADIGLIVFDECHHTRKNNPYNCIMQEFYHPAKARRFPVPKIFGMTASLVTKKRQKEEVWNSFDELERNLDSKIMTTSRDDVRQHATSANELDVAYTMNVTPEHFPLMFHLFERASVRLTLGNRLSLQYHRQAQRSSAWRLDSKKQKGPMELQIRQIANVQHVVSVMGLLAGCYALKEVADGWQGKEDKKLNPWSFPSAIASTVDLSTLDERIHRHPDLRSQSFGSLAEVLYHAMYEMVVAMLTGLFQMQEATARQKLANMMDGQPTTVGQLQRILRQIRTSIDLRPMDDLILNAASNPDLLGLPPDPGSSVFLSHRMQQLCRVLKLEESRIAHEERSSWRGMIFVQQTLMAVALEQTLSLNPHMSFFKCQSLTGHNGTVLSAAMDDQHQRTIVNMFRSGRTNLLICTSVAEEGLDIAQCSMVVRFDLPFTEASYIQSRGRARKPGSSYVMFVNSDDPGEYSMVGNIRFAELCMKEFAAYRQQQEDVDDDEDLISGTQDAYTEISQSEHDAIIASTFDGSEAGSNTAPEMIYKYASQLPQDEYCQLMPHLIFRSHETDGRSEFQYQLTLPGNAAVTRPILGEWCTSKVKAKRSACYAACLELRSLGELNKRFYPISRREQADFKRKAIKVNSALLSVDTPIDPDTLKPIHATREQGSADLGKAPSSSAANEKLVLYLHVAILKPSVDSVVERFGILTLRKLDCLMSFPLYHEAGNLEVVFEEGGKLLMSDEEIVNLKKYHLAVAESLYFKAKLFTSVCREDKHDFGSVIDSSVDFLPEALKQYEDGIPHVNQSWYLLCPVKTSSSTATHKADPIFGSVTEEQEDDDSWMEDDEATNTHQIDWDTIKRVSDRVNSLHTAGFDKSKASLESLEYGEILISPYNRNAYKFVGVRWDLNLNSAFPSQPKKEFYDPSMTKVYKGSYVPNRSGSQFSSFLEYYTEHWKFEDLDTEQPLLECISFKQVPIMKRAKNLLNPTWRQSLEAEGVEETLDDWNVAVHVLPQLLVLYPLSYPFWNSLAFMVAICWKMESMVKAAELRETLFDQTTRIERSISPPDVAMIFESVTSKSCQEHCTYERLEFIGDAVLKYVASLYCYFKFPLGHEGVLTTERISIISNRHLAQCAVAMGLQHYVRSVQIGDHPWRPAGCQFLDAYWKKMGQKSGGHSWFGGRTQKVSQQNQEHQSAVRNMTVKQVADVVEALLGACYMHGDMPCVCALMQRVGIVEGGASFLLLTQQDGGSFGPWLNGISDCMETGLDGLDEFAQTRKRQFKHGRDISSLEEAIGYQFQSPAFALEAITHCSWPHPDPPCYQRLEYLGDAVLDFMIGTHYYKAYAELDPGRLTALRSASVNNDRLAASAAKLEVFKHIMHFSAYLQSHISEYVSGFTDADEAGAAPKVLGDIVESLIGAVYLDLNGDLSRTWEIWSPLLQPFYTPESVPIHPIVQLTSFCQTQNLKLDFVVSRVCIASTSTEDPESTDDLVDDSDDDEEDEWEKERLCGKQALVAQEESKKPTKSIVQVVVNGKVVGEGEGLHAKGARKQAAMMAMQSLPWDLNSSG